MVYFSADHAASPVKFAVTPPSGIVATYSAAVLRTTRAQTISPVAFILTTIVLLSVVLCHVLHATGMQNPVRTLLQGFT